MTATPSAARTPGVAEAKAAYAGRADAVTYAFVHGARELARLLAAGHDLGVCLAFQRHAPADHAESDADQDRDDEQS